MTSPAHHISDELLLAYAGGRLRPAAALVVACHLDLCPECRERLRFFEAIGGVLLEQQPLADLSPDLFERTLARLDETPLVPALSPQALQARGPDSIVLPAPLRDRTIGRWRWMGPGMRYARVTVEEDPQINLVLLGIKPGCALPVHGHSGSELTLVLQGAYRDRSGRFGPGDLAEEDEDSEHQPLVEDGMECICLAAIDGPMRPQGRIARLLMPLFGL